MIFSSLVALVLTQATAVSVTADDAVAGVVVDSADRSVQGAAIMLSCGVMPDGTVPALEQATSDAEGRFRMKWPGQEVMRSASGRVVVLWAHHEVAGLAVTGVSSPAESADQEVRLKLNSSQTVQFKVVGRDGQPVRGVRVVPFYVHDQTRVLRASAIVPHALGERLAAESNADGLVEFRGLPPALDLWRVRITTPAGYSQVLAPALGKSLPIPILLTEPAGQITGRVVDASGRPAADVPVEVWARPVNMAYSPIPLLINGQRSFRTASDGTYSVPPQLLTGQAYRVVVRADCTEPCYSPILQPKAREDHQVADLALRPLRTIKGRVLDGAGKPVAGARVMQSGDGPKRTRTTTDEQGRFRLDGFRHGRVFLFVERPGFRFHGRPVEADAGQVEAVLTRTDEPPARSLRALPSVLPPDQERKLALELIKPYARQALEKPNGPDAFQLLGALAEMEPTTVLEWLQEKPDIDSQISSILTHEIVQKLATEDLEEALAVAASIKHESIRVHALIDAGAAVAENNRAKRTELLSQAQLQAQAVNSPGERIDLLSRIAGRWLEVGETDRARELLREARELVEKNSKDPFVVTARWRLAVSLAPIDLAEALELLKTVKQDVVRDRPYLFVAIRLARTNPAEAEPVLALAGASLTNESGYYKCRLCQRMATKDWARARRIAATMDDPVWKVRALIQVADAVATTDPAAARALVDEGFAVFAQMAEQGDDGSSQAVAALSVVERVDPNLIDEFLWRAIALRPVMPDVRGADASLYQDEGMARGLALYDRTLARHFVDSAMARRESSGPEWGSPIALEALVLIDPRRAVELAEQQPGNSDRPGYDPKKFMIVRVARLLALHDQARQRTIMNSAGFAADDADDF